MPMLPLRRPLASTGWIVCLFLLVYIIYRPSDAGSAASDRPWLAGTTSLLENGMRLVNSPRQRSPDALHVENPLERQPALMVHPQKHAGSTPPPSSETRDNSLFGPWASFESLFFFGDSYTSTNFDVNGEQPHAEHPLGNHGATSTMKLTTWATFITKTHNESLLYGYDLAIGGSTLNWDLAKPYILGQDYRSEVDTFMEHYAPSAEAPKASWHPDTSLFFVWFGINDLMLEWYRENPKQADMVGEFETYRNTTERLYAAGARKFMFLTVPPAYRSVDFFPETLLTIAEDMALFNSRILDMRSTLAEAYPDATFAVFDAHSFWARVMENPKEFEETKDVVFPKTPCEEPEKDEEEEEEAAAKAKEQETAGKLRKRGANNIHRLHHNQLGIDRREAAESEWLECIDGAPELAHLWTVMHGTAVIHNATSARIVRDCLGPQGKRGYCL